MKRSTLSDLVIDLQSGFACGESVEDGVVQLRMNNVDTEGRIDLTSKRRVPRSAVRDVHRFELVSGDVLFNNTNSPELVGKSAVFRGFDEPVVFSNHFTRIRVRPDRLEPRYLGRWLASQWRTGRFSRMCNQWVNQASVPKKELLSLSVPTRPLPEQRRIADILDKADAIRRKRKEAIALTEELLRAAFLEMFGDPVGNPRGWAVHSFGELCTKIQYGTAVKANTERRGVGVVRMNNIGYRGRVDLSDLKWVELPADDEAELLLRPGDVLFNRTNSPELVGKTAVWRENTPAVFAGYLLRLKLREDLVLPDYVGGALNSDHGKKLLLGIAKQSINMANISASDLARQRIAVPPLKTQRAFAGVVARIEALRAPLAGAAKEADTLFSSLLDRAFRGELTS